LQVRQLRDQSVRKPHEIVSLEIPRATMGKEDSKIKDTTCQIRWRPMTHIMQQAEYNHFIDAHEKHDCSSRRHQPVGRQNPGVR